MKSVTKICVVIWSAGLAEISYKDLCGQLVNQSEDIKQKQNERTNERDGQPVWPVSLSSDTSVALWPRRPLRLKFRFQKSKTRDRMENGRFLRAKDLNKCSLLSFKD